VTRKFVGGLGAGTWLVSEPGEVDGAGDVESWTAPELLAFIDRCNQTARPFNWTFTAADLARLLQRISTHPEPQSAKRLPDKALAVSRAMSDRSVTLPV
jgi:hypothetical protein